MSKIYVKNSSIHVAFDKCDRILVVFPHPVCANRALTWCHKHSTDAVGAALSLAQYCAKKNIPTFGHEFGDSWGNLAGSKPYKVGIENLSPSSK